MQWGEQRNVENKHNETIIMLRETDSPHRSANLTFKVFDDAVAFNFEFLAQPDVDSIIITDENSEFILTGDHTCFWIPGD